MLELERILENKPIRPPAISTLALRWQSAGPPGPPSSIGGPCGADTPKEEEVSIGEEPKEASKQGFCEIQWQKETLDNNKFTIIKSTTKLDKISSSSGSKDTIRYIQISTSNNNLSSSQNNSNTRLDSTSNTNYNNIVNEINKTARQHQQFDRNKSIDSVVAPNIPEDNILIATTNQNSSSSNSSSNHDNKTNKIKRNSSLISFKSLDISLKSIYSNLRHKNVTDTSKSGTDSSSSSFKRAPYVKIDDFDKNESETLLIYPASPGGSQHRGSFDKSSQRYLTTNEYSQSNTSSPFLSISTSHIRRSSTSDIIDKNPKVVQNERERRPSASDLLRKARERKGSDSSGRIGRSISQGGLTRGGARGGRRTSIAF